MRVDAYVLFIVTPRWQSFPITNKIKNLLGLSIKIVSSLLVTNQNKSDRSSVTKPDRNSPFFSEHRDSNSFLLSHDVCRCLSSSFFKQTFPLKFIISFFYLFRCLISLICSTFYLSFVPLNCIWKVEQLKAEAIKRLKVPWN